MPKTLKNFRLTHQACENLKVLALELETSETSVIERILLNSLNEPLRFYQKGYMAGVVEGKSRLALQQNYKASPLLERLNVLKANKNAPEGALVGVNK